jgi:hypothetical protein
VCARLKYRLESLRVADHRVVPASNRSASGRSESKQAPKLQSGTADGAGSHLRVMDDEVLLLHRYLGPQILALFA